MSDYGSTVRVSLSRLDSEELIEKLRKNQLTDEAASIAEEILKDRGVSTTMDTAQDQVSFSVTKTIAAEDISYIGYPISAIFIWMAMAFLFGISQTVKWSGSTGDDTSVVMVRLTQGFFNFLLAGIILGIYAYVKRNKITTREEVLKKYRSNIKTIYVTNIIVLIILLAKLFFGYSNFFAFLDLAIVASLTIAIFKRVKIAKYLLSIYAFISPVAFVFSGHAGPAGMVWSFVFLACCQAIATERRFSEANEQ